MVTTEAPPTRRERGKAQKREQIFEAARTLFHAHDFSEVTTQKIADTADVAVGTLFRYVQSKDELLLLMHDTVWQPPAGLDGLLTLLRSAAAPCARPIPRRPRTTRTP